ncbi:MAG: asparagine synthase (glutamine-hydrolyzing) [Rhodothermaceae bacterium]
MCGILGRINRVGKNNHNIERFNYALDLMEHRGPDDKGVSTENNVIFGQRRLSIIDLDQRSKQPIYSNDKSIVIILNGEIYNYLELKEQLIHKGYKFRTESDTEVIINGYLEYGIDFIEKLIGMFAFAIHDLNKNVSYIVRDRLGIKPLYYRIKDNEITFASEIKSVLHYDDVSKELNTDAISSYMSFRYPILLDSFYKEINSLTPGSYITVQNDNLKFVKYWDPISNFKLQEEDLGEEFYINKVRELLKSSVRYRMISDVPFGAFLSGGVDSSVITAIMAQEMKDPVKTFTIGFEEQGYNEFEYAKIVADKYKTEHREIILSGENYISTMENLINYKDAPLSVPNEVPLYLMSCELKKYITVVLSGEGADEIFGGYGRIFRSPHDWKRFTEINNGDYSESEKSQFLKLFALKYGEKTLTDELDHFVRLYSYTNLEDKTSLLSNEINLNAVEEKLRNKFNFHFEELLGESYYNKMMYAFEKVHILGLLHRVDTSTMATAVEARVPFVDHRLVEFAFSIPVKYKLKWNSDRDKFAAKLLMSDKISEVYDTPKYILKKSYEGMIPDEILYRKKMGFPVPLNNWFGGEFNSYAKEVLLSKSARERGIYNTSGIEKWLNDETMSNSHSFAMKIWMLINLELFIKNKMDI